MTRTSKRTIRTIIGALSLSLATTVGLHSALADDYPNKPIEFVVGYLPGGATDFTARVMAEAMSPILGQPIIVNNKPGAASAIAVEQVKRADPDGYTLLFGNNDAMVITPAVKADLSYKIPDDLTFVSRVVEFPLVFVVSSNVPIKDMNEFVAYAKANPGKFNYGSSGVGSSLHVEAVRVAQAAGIEMTHVPYKGAAGAVTDMVAGTIDGMFATIKDVSAHLTTGTIKIIAATSADRVPAAPDVPTLEEVGLGEATVTGWFALMGPANLPAEVSEKLSKAVAEAVAKPEVAKRLADNGLYVSVLSGADFTKYVVDQYQIFKDVSDKQNIKITD